MLYWTWACVFLVVAVLLALVDAGETEPTDATGLSSLCTLASVALLWPVAGNRVFAWLDTHLPQPAASIHFATAVVLFGLLVVVYWGAVFATAEGICRLWTKRRSVDAGT